MQQARVLILHGAFLIFSVLTDVSGTSLEGTGIVRYMDSKNAQGKKLSIYHLHCYPTVYLLELSSKFTVYVDEPCGQGSALLYYINILTFML